MTRLALLMVAVVGLFGCATKPSEEDCRQAITNMQTLMGTENLRQHDVVESQVRRCKGGSSKKSVQCAIKATTLDELRKCEFYKVPDNAPGIGGSAAPPAGSAAGSAGSAAGSAGSAAGSAAPPTGSEGSAGSAAGSAGSAGSAATGSAGSANAGSAGSAAAGSAK